MPIDPTKGNQPGKSVDHKSGGNAAKAKKDTLKSESAWNVEKGSKGVQPKNADAMESFKKEYNEASPQERLVMDELMKVYTEAEFNKSIHKEIYDEIRKVEKEQKEAELKQKMEKDFRQYTD